MKECKECGKLTTNPKYCSKSCSAKQSNENRTVKCPNRDAKKNANCVECKSVVGINIRASGRNVKCQKCLDKNKPQKENIEEVLANRSFGSDVLRLTEWARRYLLTKRGSKCECCGIGEWQGKPVSFEIDHTDGNKHNNLESNLKILCPNCHSQTTTWRGRNSNNGKRKNQENEVLEAFKKEGNIHKTLLKLGLAAKGANYETVKRILIKNGVSYF